MEEHFETSFDIDMGLVINKNNTDFQAKDHTVEALCDCLECASLPLLGEFEEWNEIEMAKDRYESSICGGLEKTDIKLENLINAFTESSELDSLDFQFNSDSF